MKKLVFAEIEFSKRALEALEESKTSLNVALTNQFESLSQLKFKEGLDLAKQKMYTKVSDKLFESTEEVELSDEQFDFMFDLFSTVQAPPNLYTAPIAEYLEQLKLIKE